jgi:hypothetical protein
LEEPDLTRFRFALLVVLVSLPLTLAACGGDDDTSSNDQTELTKTDEDQITKTIEFAVVSGNPKACTEAQTQAFTEQTTGETGAAAVKQCEKDAQDTPADSVEVSNFDGDSDSATADIAFTGQFFDGQTIAVELVKDGGKWKLDKAVEFKDFDRDAFISALEKSLAGEPGAPPGAVDCVSKNLDKLSDQQIEDLFLNSNTQLENQVFNPCFQG